MSIDRKAYGTTIFTIAYTLTVFFGVLFTSVYAKYIFSTAELRTYVIKVLLFGCLYFNIFVYRTYNIKKIIIHAAITAGLIFVAHNTHNQLFLWVWLMLVAMHGISFRWLAKTALVISGIAVALVVGTTFWGYGTDYIFERTGTFFYYRHSFGFLDPNLFSGYILQICLAAIYLRWKNFNSKDNIFLFMAFCIVTFLANSRTCSLLLILLIFLVNFCKYGNKNFADTFNYKLSQIMIMFCPIITFIITKLYTIHVKWVIGLDELTSYRFRNIAYSLTTYPVTLFGTRTQLHHEMNIMGNLYGNILLKYGLFIFLLYLAGYFFTILKAIQYKNTPVIIILTINLLMGICECSPYKIYMNFSILAFSVLINNNNMFEENKV